MSVGLQWTNRKSAKIVTLYKWEVFKKIPCLGTFCTQSVNKGLIYNGAGMCSLLTSFLNSALLADMFLNLIEVSFGLWWLQSKMPKSNLIPVILKCSSLSLDHKQQAQTLHVSALILHLIALFSHENCNVSTLPGSSKLHCSASTGNCSFSSFISSPYSEHWKSWMKWQHKFFQNPVL